MSTTEWVGWAIGVFVAIILSVFVFDTGNVGVDLVLSFFAGGILGFAGLTAGKIYDDGRVR